ncbi:MAG: epoxyqueuosine reductase QueH [Clostridia bacterium]
MKLLMHTCCAPCSVQCIQSLRDEGLEPTLFWYNPNIHPYTEYKNRLDALISYAKTADITLIKKDEYGLEHFLTSVMPSYHERCAFCYASRLEETAKFASQNGYGAYTTTLLISPYQNHSLLCKMGKEFGQKYGVMFCYKDFRPLFREGQRIAREQGLYMQKYCGCIFSEMERYLPDKRPKTSD